MAKIRMDDKVGRDKFDPYKDTLVTTVRGTEEEVREVLDKIMGDETNKIERISREERRMCLIKKDDVVIAINDAVRDLVNYNWEDPDRMLIRKILHNLRLTVQEMPKIEKSSWISVKERMPEAEQKVLVYAVGYDFGFEGDTVMAITCPSMHRDGSMYWRSPWQYFQSDYKITHWMPMPDAPEVEDE